MRLLDITANQLNSNDKELKFFDQALNLAFADATDELGIGQIEPRDRDVCHAPNEADQTLSLFSGGLDLNVAGNLVHFAKKEKQVLDILLLGHGNAVTRAEIFAGVFGNQADSSKQVLVECYISKIRKKLRAAIGHDPIQFKKNVGYWIEFTS